MWQLIHQRENYQNDCLQGLSFTTTNFIKSHEKNRSIIQSDSIRYYNLFRIIITCIQWIRTGPLDATIANYLSNASPALCQLPLSWAVLLDYARACCAPRYPRFFTTLSACFLFFSFTCVIIHAFQLTLTFPISPDRAEFKQSFVKPYSTFASNLYTNPTIKEILNWHNCILNLVFIVIFPRIIPILHSLISLRN